ncbi:FtsK/SpoIIIE family DNA translocase [Prolixibacter denitrificans]|uniref:DNA translocase FtsK n=1 Tax=Prolixibacter denitrificans TaxID=1541063 RepID=A0A2P8CG59_9BACT|nr:DNA translocase FtsK [Prolixibacter denitrificans]PSK83879.1 S-DNA-T family DNA segregation ATPase FtsK/SpoIIIE [Prolixibacter denitrificans]GET23420.1 DNA translocase FtsK [Prolixibacter denitrificans]
MARKKTSNTSRKKNQKSNFRNRLSKLSSWERVGGILSIGLFFFALYLLISLISFLLSGGADQSQLSLTAREILTNPNLKIENVGGKWGANMADWFINRGIGLASFGVVYLLLILAIKLGRIHKVSLSRNFGYGIFLIIWTSVALGYFMAPLYEQSYLYPGGAYGFFISQWFNSVIGNVGTFFLLMATMLICIIIAFENAWPVMRKWMTRVKKQPATDAPLSDEEVYSEPKAPVINEKDDAFAKVVEEDDEVEVVYADDKNKEDDIEIELEPEPEENSPLQKTEGDKEKGPKDPELEVEKRKEDDVVDSIQQDLSEDYDPTLDLSRYEFPSLDLLKEWSTGNPQVTNEELIANKNRIVETLKNYNIEIVKIKATSGPTITLYEIVPAPGIRISKIKNLEDDIALSLAALGIRIIAPIPGKGTVGIEVPNRKPEIVSMRSIIASRTFQESEYELPIALGKTISNETYAVDLTKMPHILVAGATGQGKSVGLNAIITSLVYKKHPSQLKFVFVDPKKVELNLYSVMEKHYLAKMPGEDDPIITDVQKVKNTLNSLNLEMDNRYDLLKKAHARNIKEYNQKFISRRLNPEKGFRYLPYIVVVIDEFADLIMTAGKEIELPIARIAQLARAVGIHMIIATQRPSTNIITGVIKANFPARIAFRVASMVDSRTILDSPGANQLIGKGDMLVSTGSSLTRVQCAFVDTPEVESIVHFIGEQPGYPTAFLLPEYMDESSDEPGAVDLKNRDDLFDEAARLVVLNQTGSTSAIQRKFSIGYNRAGRIMDQLEAAGVVGPNEGSKARQVLLQDEYSLEQLLNNL